METPMQIDAVSPLSSNRKRPVRHRDADSEDEEGLGAGPVADELLTTPLKRLQNSKGYAVHRRILKYNAQALLNDLAFTRLYVTANFQNYNPTLSPIILCVVSEHRLLYHALCAALPSIYAVAPSLQALAIATGPAFQQTVTEGDRTRSVPVFTTSDLQDTTAEEFERFEHALPGSLDTIAVIDASGTCLWTSDELETHDDRHGNAEAWLTANLERALVQTLKGTTLEDRMDEG